MGAQVIVAVRHDRLHDITPIAMRALDGMVSENDSIPRHFEPSAIDNVSYFETGNGSTKQGILSSQYHDMDGRAVLLINNSFLCSMPQLIGLDTSKVSGFSDISRFIKTQFRKRSYPFSSARIKHTLEECEPSPLLPASSTMISLFSYYTDSWDWSSQRRNGEECLADLITYCRTGEGARRTFGFYDAKRGYDGNRLAPLATFPSHLMAVVAMHMGRIEVVTMPAREMGLEYESLGLDLSSKRGASASAINEHVFQTLMKSQGHEHRRVARKDKEASGPDLC